MRAPRGERLGKVTLLIADDLKFFLEVESTYLKRAGYQLERRRPDDRKRRAASGRRHPDDRVLPAPEPPSGEDGGGGDPRGAWLRWRLPGRSPLHRPEPGRPGADSGVRFFLTRSS